MEKIVRTCDICDIELNCSNQPLPLFGSNTLLNGKVVCKNCFVNLNKISIKMAFRLKKFSNEEIIDLFAVN